MATLTEQVRAMSRLPSNWDGYGADAPIPGIVKYAEELATHMDEIAGRMKVRPTLCAFPTRVGGVQFEVEGDRLGIEIELNPDGSVGLLAVNKQTGETKEERINAGTTPVPAELHARLQELEALFAGAA